jgi:hypothetical protein
MIVQTFDPRIVRRTWIVMFAALTVYAWPASFLPRGKNAGWALPTYTESIHRIRHPYLAGSSPQCRFGYHSSFDHHACRDRDPEQLA